MPAVLLRAADNALAPLLTVSGLEVRFGAVRALDLSVRPRELIALAGVNGAGKTKLVRPLAGRCAWRDLPAAPGQVS